MLQKEKEYNSLIIIHQNYIEIKMSQLCLFFKWDSFRKVAR